MDAPNPSQNDVVAQAARWLAEQVEPPRAAVPELKKRFGLSAVQACDAIALAARLRAEGEATV